MMHGRSVLFLTEDLLHKWGFMDGNILDDIIKECIPEFNRILNEEIKNEVHFRDARALYLSIKCLEIIVRKYILPKIPHEIVLQIVIGHNPVRVLTFDGEKVDDYLYPPKFKIEPKFIEIPYETLIEEIKRTWNDPCYHEEICKKYPDPAKKLKPKESC